MTLPNARESTTVYLLTRTLDIATRIAKMQGIEDYDTVFVGKNYKQFIRGKGDRTLYCCGEFHHRSDEQEVRRYAESLDWKVEYGFPPKRTAP